MNRSALLLLAIPVLLAASELGQAIEFAPKSGLVVRKTFQQSDETALDDMTITVNGQEQGSDMVEMEQEFSNKLEIVLIDEYGAVADGRPTRLKRTFETISSGTTVSMSNPMMGDMTMNMKGTSELEGKTVIFTRKKDADEYVAAFPEDQSFDEDLLVDLEEDADLRAFLPSGEVEEGGTWEVEPSALRNVLAYGGSLKIDIEVDGPDMMGGMGGSQQMPTLDQMLGELEGTINAEYRGTRKEDGEEVAAIHLSISIESAKDMTEIFREMMEDAEMPEEMEVEMEYQSVDMEFELEADAVLLWNLAGGHLHSFEMTGKVRTLMDMAISMSMGGMGDMEVENSLDLRGTQTISITVEAEGA